MEDEPYSWWITLPHDLAKPSRSPLNGWELLVDFVAARTMVTGERPKEARE